MLLKGLLPNFMTWRFLNRTLLFVFACTGYSPRAVVAATTGRVARVACSVCSCHPCAALNLLRRVTYLASEWPQKGR